MDFEKTTTQVVSGEQSVVSIPGKIEAENYNTMSGVDTQTTTDAGGGLNVGWIDQGDWMSYKVNATTAGPYTASFRVACPYTGAAFQLRASNGAVLATINVPNTGDFQTWQTISATVTLPAGSQTLQLYSTNSFSWNFNWMQFSILGTAAIPGKIEAENYTTMSGVGTEITSDAGGTMDVGWINQGDWMNYSVNVDTAGKYTASFRVAASSTGAGLQLRLANGTVLATVTLPNTGGSQVWQTVSATVTLPAGSQTLQIYSTSTVGWNINWIQFAGGATAVTTNALTKTTTNEEKPDTSGMEPAATVASSFTLYPNPFADHITIQINNGYTGQMSVQLISVSGQLLKTYNSTKDQPYAEVNLAASNLPAGIYFVRVQIGSSWNIVKKVIKQ
jgi:endoglucanase